MTAINKKASPARPENKIKGGGGISSTPDAPIFVKYHAKPKLPNPNISEIILKKIGTRFQTIYCSFLFIANPLALLPTADTFP